MSAGFDPYYEWLGIPPEHQPPHHYRLLGIELFESSESVIEKAADRQMGFLRSLQLGQHGAMSQKLLGEVAAAKLCLLDRARKASYDEALRLQLSPPPLPAPPGGPRIGEIRSAPPPVIEPIACAAGPLPSVAIAPGSAKPILATRRGLWLGAIGGLAALALVGLVLLVLNGRPSQERQIARQSVEPNRPIDQPAQPTTESSPAGTTLQAEADRDALPASEPRGEIDASAPPSDVLPELNVPAEVPKKTPAKRGGRPARARPAKAKNQPPAPASGGVAPLPASETLAPLFTKVDLPSGRSLSLATAALAENWFESRTPRESGIYVVEFPNEQPAELHAFLNAKLHGPSVGLYEGGGRRMAATYDKGQRDGALYLWNEAQQPILYAEYRLGRPNGLSCLFDAGRPSLVQEFDKSQLAAEYLVTWAGNDPTVHPIGEIRDKRLAAVVDQSKQKAAELMAEVDRLEAATKRELADWFRQKDQQLTQQTVAQAGMAKRRAIIGAINAQGAAQRTAIERAMRQALRRAGL